MITRVPIGTVHSARKTTDDDYWGSLVSTIVLADHLHPDCLLGLETFSHAEILYWFDRVEDAKIIAARSCYRPPPREGTWPGSIAAW